MKFYRVKPEVAGGWGENTTFTRTPGAPTVVHKFHYEFDGWLGDELLNSSPCYIVSKRMSLAIKGAQLTGFRFDAVEVTTSDEFKELYPNLELPEFLWLRIEGRPGWDDFGLFRDVRLIVSERALGALTSVGISHASILPFEP